MRHGIHPSVSVDQTRHRHLKGQIMRKDRASRTSESAALARAVHYCRDGEPKIFLDPYAMNFMLWYYRFAFMSKALHAFLFDEKRLGWANPVFGQIVSRARYAEDRLEKAMERGIDQYVILGAGMDSFVLRKQEKVKSLTVFEVDHPKTQSVKINRLKKLGFSSSAHVEFVPVNFERESIADGLSRSSFDKEKPAFFSWMGTTVYLERQSVIQTLVCIASFVTNQSELVFDFIDDTPFSHGYKPSPWLRKTMEYAGKKGEPMITGFSEVELNAILTENGYVVDHAMIPKNIEPTYFSNRTDGLRTIEHSHFISVILNK